MEGGGQLLQSLRAPWAGLACGLWPEGFVSGTQDTSRGGGGFPCFHVFNSFHKHLYSACCVPGTMPELYAC